MWIVPVLDLCHLPHIHLTLVSSRLLSTPLAVLSRLPSPGISNILKSLLQLRLHLYQWPLLCHQRDPDHVTQYQTSVTLYNSLNLASLMPSRRYHMLYLFPRLVSRLRCSPDPPEPHLLCDDNEKLSQWSQRGKEFSLSKDDIILIITDYLAPAEQKP